jgi:hypothetical protein
MFARFCEHKPIAIFIPSVCFLICANKGNRVKHVRCQRILTALTYFRGSSKTEDPYCCCELKSPGGSSTTGHVVSAGSNHPIGCRREDGCFPVSRSWAIISNPMQTAFQQWSRVYCWYKKLKKHFIWLALMSESRWLHLFQTMWNPCHLLVEAWCYFSFFDRGGGVDWGFLKEGAKTYLYGINFALNCPTIWLSTFIVCANC